MREYRTKKGKLPIAFKKEQLIKIFDECSNVKLGMAMWLGFFCGLRIREVCRLKVNDIDLNNKTLFVRDSKNTNRAKQGYGKDRVVSIPDIALSPIRKWLSIIEGGEWFLPSAKCNNEPIQTKTIHEHYRALLRSCFLSEAETITSYRAKNYGVKKDLKKSTYIYRFHTLRHSYATYLLDRGVPLEIIQKLLGHESLDTTLIYAKISHSKIKEQVNQAFNTPQILVNQGNPINNGFQAVSLSAKEILQQRLARGEIDLTTYRALLSQITEK